MKEYEYKEGQQEKGERERERERGEREREGGREGGGMSGREREMEGFRQNKDYF